MTVTVKRKKIHNLIRRRIELVKKIKNEKDETKINSYKEEIKLIEKTIIEIRGSEWPSNFSERRSYDYYSWFMGYWQS